MRIGYQHILSKVFLSFVIILTSLIAVAQNTSPQPIRIHTSAGYNNTDSDSYRKTHINSQIQAGSLRSNSTTLNITGANLLADDIDITTETLNVASLQDEERSQSKTRGSSVGMGFSASGAPSSVSGGINQADSKAKKLWTNQQTTILGSNSVTIRAKDTTLTGAVIANAIQNEDGSLSDQGNLDFETNTLAVNDLVDIDESKSTSFNLNVSHNLAGDKGSKDDPNEAGKDPNRGSTTIGGSNNGHSKEQITRASLGGGAIRIGGQDKTSTELAALGINTDLSKTQEITKDMQTGGLDATVTIDHRMLSKEGRAERKAEKQDAFNHGKNLGRAAKDALTSDKDTFLGELRQYAQERRDIEAAWKEEKLQQAVNSDADAETKQAGAQGLANALADGSGVDRADVALYDGTQTQDDSLLLDSSSVNTGKVAGAYHEDGKRIYINTDKTNMTDGVDVATVVGHESTRNRLAQDGQYRSRDVETSLARNHGNSVGEVWEAMNTRGGVKTGAAAGYSQQTWNQTNNNSQTVKTGTSRISTVDSRDLKARQLNYNEATILDKARNKITLNTGLSRAEKNKAMRKLDALACAEVNCAEGIPESDKRYAAMQELQAEGNAYGDEDIFSELADLGVDATSTKEVGRGKNKVTTDEFQYDLSDWAGDKADKHEEGIKQTGGVLLATGSAVGAVAGSLTTGAGAITCPVTGVGCGVAAVGAAGTALAVSGFKDGVETATADFDSTRGQEVEDSFSAKTHQGDRSAVKEAATDAAIGVAIAVGSKVGLDKAKKVVDKAMDSEAAKQLAAKIRGQKQQDLNAGVDGEMSGKDVIGDKSTRQNFKDNVHQRINQRAEAKEFMEKHGIEHTGTVTGKKANMNTYSDKGYSHPSDTTTHAWNNDDIVYTGTLKKHANAPETRSLGRVHETKDVPDGDWLSSGAKLKNNGGSFKTAKEIQENFAIERKPKYASTVKPRHDVKVQVGPAGTNKWGKGGDVQVEGFRSSVPQTGDTGMTFRNDGFESDFSKAKELK